MELKYKKQCYLSFGVVDLILSVMYVKCVHLMLLTALIVKLCFMRTKINIYVLVYCSKKLRSLMYFRVVTYFSYAMYLYLTDVQYWNVQHYQITVQDVLVWMVFVYCVVLWQYNRNRKLYSTNTEAVAWVSFLT